VLIVGIGSVLEQGVQNLLAQEPNVRVWNAGYTNEGAFRQDVLRTRPDVILFHELGALDAGRIFDLLRAISTLEALRVIVLRSSSTAMDLYEKRTVHATGNRDLLALVLSDDHQFRSAVNELALER
jgi:DNA-binding NarL/FixJ family response regulator